MAGDAVGAVDLTLANASAAGTTAGAPTPLSMGPETGSAPAPAAPQPGQPPVGKAANPPVAPHAAIPSVGTHKTASPSKHENPAHGMAESPPKRGGTATGNRYDGFFK